MIRFQGKALVFRFLREDVSLVSNLSPEDGSRSRPLLLAKTSRVSAD